MKPSPLRIYPADPSSEDTPQAAQRHDTAPIGVEVTLGEILPVLAEAYHTERTWLRDLREEKIVISSDLHDVLSMCRHFYRPSA